jgi:hypothetical protein
MEKGKLQGALAGLTATLVAFAIVLVAPVAAAEFPVPTYDHHPAKKAKVVPRPTAKHAQSRPTASTRTKARPAAKAAPPQAKAKPAPAKHAAAKPPAKTPPAKH